MVIISHDRAFLDRTVDDVLVIDDGRARRWPGGYAGWLADQEGSSNVRTLDTSGTRRGVRRHGPGPVCASQPKHGASRAQDREGHRKAETVAALLDELEVPEPIMRRSPGRHRARAGTSPRRRRGGLARAFGRTRGDRRRG